MLVVTSGAGKKAGAIVTLVLDTLGSAHGQPAGSKAGRLRPSAQVGTPRDPLTSLVTSLSIRCKDLPDASHNPRTFAEVPFDSVEVVDWERAVLIGRGLSFCSRARVGNDA